MHNRLIPATSKGSTREQRPTHTSLRRTCSRDAYIWWWALAGTVVTGMIGMCAFAVGSAVIITAVTPLSAAIRHVSPRNPRDWRERRIPAPIPSGPRGARPARASYSQL